MSLGDAGTPIVLTANTILSGNTAGAITLGGTVNGGYSLTVNTTGTTTLSGDIGGNTALTTLTTNTGGTTVISVDIETSSTQTYNDAVTINGTLDFTGSTVQFANTLAGDDGTGDNLTISGALDLDGAATSLTSLTVEGTSNLGADVTTSGTQTYSGAVVLSNDVTLTTTDSNITFAVTVDGDGTARDLTIDMDNSGVGADGTVQFANTVGANDDLDVIDITGNLNLDAAISNTTSLSVSGTSNLGANVTTSSTQTYTSAVTLSGGDRILTGTIINFGSTLAGGTNALTITGNVDLDGAATDLSTLSVSGTSNLGADVTTSGTQTYTGDVTISADISLNTSDGDVTFDGDINTADTSSSESGVLQFLGGGSYKYSTDNGSTYSTGTATSSATTLGTGSLTYSAGSYTWTTPDGASATKLLVVGGGGGAGGGYVGAGGGAGGYVYNASYSIDASTNYIVTVGAGGAGGGFQVIGSNGSSSYFGDVEAYGGGGGGTYSGKVPPACPVNGCGSSGGAGWNVSDANIRAASSQGNIGTGPQSSSHGCTGTTCNGNSGGAGGGAGGAGQKHTTAVALTANANVPSGYYSTTPTGGIGLANDITGTSTYYAGGGGSGSDGLGGNGGLGGGGNGGSGSAAPSGFQFTHGLDGEANTGGGGGGGGGSTGGLTGGDGGSGIVVVNYDYDASVYASYNLTISTGSGAVDINGAVANIGTLSITSNSTSSEASGIISTDTIITKAGSGTLLLSANNTYTGQTNINAGIISITDNNSLGSADGATIVADGASLSISNDITSAENITISGTGISSNGAIRNTADDNTLTGLITLGANSEIQIDTGSSLTLNPTTGSAVTGAYNLTIDSVGTSTISDPIAISTGNITKTGAGTLTLSGTNTYSGNTTISAGTIKLTGSVNALTDLSIASGATLDLQSTQTFATLDLDGTITRSAGSSELTITGASDLEGSITTSGTQTYSGAVALSTDVTLTTTDSNITFSSTVDGDGTARDLTIDMDNSGVGADGTVQFANTVGANNSLDVIDITGNLKSRCSNY